MVSVKDIAPYLTYSKQSVLSIIFLSSSVAWSSCIIAFAIFIESSHRSDIVINNTTKQNYILLHGAQL